MWFIPSIISILHLDEITGYIYLSNLPFKSWSAAHFYSFWMFRCGRFWKEHLTVTPNNFCLCTYGAYDEIDCLIVPVGLLNHYKWWKLNDNGIPCSTVPHYNVTKVLWIENVIFFLKFISVFSSMVILLLYQTPFALKLFIRIAPQ